MAASKKKKAGIGDAKVPQLPHAVIGRAVTDVEFRHRLLDDPEAAMMEFKSGKAKLTADEQEAAKALRAFVKRTGKGNLKGMMKTFDALSCPGLP